MDGVVKCAEPECPNDGIACTIPGGSGHGDTTEYFCPDHATAAGYCACCGVFIAGGDVRFDAGVSRLCENCREGEDYDNEPDDDDLEFDCHRGPDGSCGLAGTEECDWECPYNRR